MWILRNRPHLIHVRVWVIIQVRGSVRFWFSTHSPHLRRINPVLGLLGSASKWRSCCTVSPLVTCRRSVRTAGGKWQQNGPRYRSFGSWTTRAGRDRSVLVRFWTSTPTHASLHTSAAGLLFFISRMSGEFQLRVDTFNIADLALNCAGTV